MKKCKVIGCKNMVLEIRESGKLKSMRGVYGYCQIHYIEGLIIEEVGKEVGG